MFEWNERCDEGTQLNTIKMRGRVLYNSHKRSIAAGSGQPYCEGRKHYNPGSAH